MVWPCRSILCHNKKMHTNILQHRAALTAFDKALLTAKIIPRLEMPHSAPLDNEATDVDVSRKFAVKEQAGWRIKFCYACVP